mmetsp:Transcript_18191/g.30203  ORF Transcript_18191/g.30203 Transcript_18191/m.30203 type:complete len:166 (-) Transcript_18191:264-761(-)
MSFLKEVPNDEDIVITTNGAKRATTRTNLCREMELKYYDDYIKITNKFSPKKKQLAQELVDALPGRFIKEVGGQWIVLNEEDSVARVMQRFCDIRRARKTKASRTIAPKDIKKKSRKIIKKHNPKLAKIATKRTAPTPEGKTTCAIREHVVTPANSIGEAFQPFD